MPKPLKDLIRRSPLYRSPVWWANLGPLSHWLAGRLPPGKTPVLVLSIPRSGSSWVGEVLGLSSRALYMREPLTRTYADLVVSGPSFFEVDARRPPPGYQTAARWAFAGNPRFAIDIIRFPQQWRLRERSSRGLVIKEVNPLALPWLMGNYQPKIVYLVRHPAAIANSFHQLGWMGRFFEPMFIRESLAELDFNYQDYTQNPWREFGALQATILRMMGTFLSNNRNHMFVRYEDLCANPVHIFKRVYDFAGFPWSEAIAREVIARSTHGETFLTGGYSVHRDSTAMIDKWKRELPPEAVEEVKNGYLELSTHCYPETEW